MSPKLQPTRADQLDATGLEPPAGPGLTPARLRAFAALLLVALGSAAFAIAFRASAHHVSVLLFGPGSLLEVFRRLRWWECLVLPLASGALAWGVLRLATRFKASASVGEVMEAVAIGRGKMSAPAAVATALATTLTRLAIGEGPIYGVRTFRLVSEVELLGFALLGVLAGVVGAGFIKLLERGERTAEHSRLSLLPKILLGALAVGAMAIALPEVVGNGFEPLSELLSGKMPLLVILALLVAKPLATTFSVSAGLPGGVFTPALLIGACVGALFGSGLEVIAGGHIAPATAYALVGLAALCAATTHAPIMAAVLGFELSGDYAIVLPLVLACACAVWVSERLQPNSLYETELRRRGLSWHEAPGERRLVKDSP